VRYRMKRFVALAATLLAALFVCGFDRQNEHIISGKTMGTTYSIKVVSNPSSNHPALGDAIEKRLKEINRSMSTYIKESEISRFNRIQDTNTPFMVSEDFWNVMAIARKLYRLTDGAWDGTVNPLVNLWGFGGRKSERKIPSKQAIDEALKTIGFKHLVFGDTERYLRKTNPAISLDLGSIAKGYGVDQISALLRENGYQHFLVEIGGEVYASGQKIDGAPWRIGINKPLPDASLNQVYRVVSIQNKGMATSGDYRNFFLKDGIRYAHILNPRTGYPAGSTVVSASVIADTCTFADGLATALVVMGPGRGIALVEQLDSVECFMVSQAPDGALIDRASSGFRVAR
jgi:FAD:protein FMN transferase